MAESKYIPGDNTFRYIPDNNRFRYIPDKDGWKYIENPDGFKCVPDGVKYFTGELKINEKIILFG